MNQHATAIRFNHLGILFVGPSGCGKSTLALELIKQGGTLIADDQVLLVKNNDEWLAQCPAAIRNKLHINGTGFITLPADLKTRIDVIFQSTEPAPSLSQPPAINKPVIQMDFKAANAKQFVVNTLTLFDRAATAA